jgi:SnoaL-like domain
MGLREPFEQTTEAWNAHEFDGVVTAFSEDCEVTAPEFTGKGHQGMRDWWDYNDGPFPDNQIVVHRTVLEGDTLVEESTFRGTNTGPLPSPTAGDPADRKPRRDPVRRDLHRLRGPDRQLAAVLEPDGSDEPAPPAGAVTEPQRASGPPKVG